MTTTAETAEEEVPRDGSLVEVRGQRWVVSDSSPGSDGSTLLTLQGVEDGRYGESLPVIWEVEPGRRLLPAGSLPEVTPDGFDPPERLAAFLDAVRWSAVTSADTRTLQAPLRSGVTVEEYQLEPVARAIEAPRVNLLLADDVGLGKTIEVGLVALEPLLRHRAKRVMIVCPPGLMVKWRDEMAEKFGLAFTIVDSAQLNQLRRSHGNAANPFRVYPLTIVSLSWLRGAKAERLLHEVIEGEDDDNRPFDLLLLDEAHHVAPAAPKQRYAVDSQQTKLIRWLAPHFEHRLLILARIVRQVARSSISMTYPRMKLRHTRRCIAKCSVRIGRSVRRTTISALPLCGGNIGGRNSTTPATPPKSRPACTTRSVPASAPPPAPATCHCSDGCPGL